MEEKESVGSRRHLGQASGLEFTQRAEAMRKGFEQGPAMIQFERSFWKHHGDWISQQGEGRNLSSELLYLLLLYTLQKLIFRSSDGQSEEADDGVIAGLGVGKGRPGQYYWSSWK